MLLNKTLFNDIILNHIFLNEVLLNNVLLNMFASWLHHHHRHHQHIPLYLICYISYTSLYYFQSSSGSHGHQQTSLFSSWTPSSPLELHHGLRPWTRILHSGRMAGHCWPDTAHIYGVLASTQDNLRAVGFWPKRAWDLHHARDQVSWTSSSSHHH